LHKRFDQDISSLNGVLWVEQIKGASQTYLTPTLVAMVTKTANFNAKLTIKNRTQYKERSCSKQGVFEIAHYNGIVKIWLRPTLVAMVKDIFGQGVVKIYVVTSFGFY